MKHVLVLAAVMGGLWAVPASATEIPALVVQKATDTADFFNGACLRTLGETKAADAVLAPLVKAKQAALISDVSSLGDVRASKAYGVKTPSGANLTLMLGPKRFCAVVASEGDQASLRNAMKNHMAAMAAGLKGRLFVSEPSTKPEAGAQVMAERYRVVLPESKATPTVVVSTANKAVNGKQHFLTFHIGKKPQA